MTRLAPILMFLALAACGVDGPPERPEPAPVGGSNVSVGISGSASFGVIAR